MDLKGFLSLFIIIIVGLVFLGVIADKTYENTDSALTNVTNQNHTWACDIGAGCDTTAATSRWTIESETLYSGWGQIWGTNATSFTQETDYNITYNNPANTVTIQISGQMGYDLALWDNISTAEYYRYAPEYVQGSSAARTILGLNKLWFAIGLFLVVGGIVLAYLRKYEWF